MATDGTTEILQTVLAVLALVGYLELRIARIVRQAAAEWLHTHRLDDRVEVLERQAPDNGHGDPRQDPSDRG